MAQSPYKLQVEYDEWWRRRAWHFPRAADPRRHLAQEPLRPDLISGVEAPRPLRLRDVLTPGVRNTAAFILRMHFAILVFLSARRLKSLRAVR
jgi:hypothetical protein